MLDFILAFFGSLLPAILYNVNKKHFIWVGLSGAAGWLAYMLALNTGIQVVVATFIGALAVGFYSETMARLLKLPATILSVSGIFPLVPGIGAYNTVKLVVENKLSFAAASAVETIGSAGSIALGIILMSALFRVVFRYMRV